MQTRELFWNISSHWLIFPLFFISLGFLIHGLMQRIKFWRIGRSEQRQDNLGDRIWLAVVEILSHRKILRDFFPGLMHLFIFWGFLVLALGTLIVALQANLGLQVLFGSFYLVFSLIMDLAGAVVIIGVSMAAYRRYIIKPDSLDNAKNDGFVLLLILIILITGFIVEGLRIIGTNDAWAIWSPVGLTFALILNRMSADAIVVTFIVTWWLHFFLAMIFFAYIPYSKLFHIISGTLNYLASSSKAGKVLSLINLDDEGAETYGVSKLEDFSWKQLLDGDVCMGCGRCQHNCPAYLSGKPLSPKALIQSLKDHLDKVGPDFLMKFNPGMDRVHEGLGRTAKNLETSSFLGEIIKDEAIWSCTTCQSCMEQCPVKVEHVPKIVDMRRYLVLVETSFSQDVQLIFRNIEYSANPWGFDWAKRADWAEVLDIKTIDKDQNVEYLYWVGCSGSFDERNKKVAEAVAKILLKVGIKFAILGSAEKCCGDSARRLGNEYLYQSLAYENIRIMNGFGVKKIITHCPHCFNTLKNEYSQMGGSYDVIHHTQLIDQLLQDSKITCSSMANFNLTYHDSCYLGRYNNVYEAPRSILKAIPGAFLKETERSRTMSFCCGAGGGSMWMKEKTGQRINWLRTEQILAVKPNVVATNCPFCLTMIEDGIRSKNTEVKVLDLSELVVATLE
jgi:Fe-S oxidoreductase/nitrate reductase gamma subunit